MVRFVVSKGETTLQYRYYIYVEVSASSPAGVGQWKLDGGTKWQMSTTGGECAHHTGFGCSCELCQGVAHCPLSFWPKWN